jgi:phosphatidyl-myo-inositol dimannoside synthase
VGRPRVLVLTPDFPPEIGGIQHLLHRVVSNWSRSDATVVTLGPRRAARNGASFDEVRVPAGPLGHRADVAVLNTAAFAAARRIRPDVVLNGHVVTAPAAAAIARVLGTPFVQYVYGQEIAYRRRLADLAFRRASAVIAISRHTAEHAASITPSLRVEVIPPGVDLPSMARPEPRRAGSTPTVVTVGRLVERYKGHDVMLRALPLVAARIPDVRWVVIGDGPRRSEYARSAAALGVARWMTLAGAVDGAERDRILDTADVFAMVSRLTAAGGGEGFGIVYLEAGAHGLPVVGGRAGGAVDAVIDGVTGLLVEPEDHVAVAAAIVDLLGHPDRARAMGAAGRERAARHAWTHVAAQVEDVLLDVAAAG